jgi:sugar phosphate isomerase/epimerase
MNRRKFLQTSSTLAAFAALPVPRIFAATPPARKMTLALAPGSIGVSVGSQRELNDLAHRHRFESVEPRSEELASMSPPQLDEILADLKTKGLVWAAAGLPVDFRKDEPTFKEGLARLPRIAGALQRAGASRVGTWLMPTHAELTYLANFKQHAARLRQVAGVLADHGLRLGLEYVGTQSLLVRDRYPFVHTMAETRDLLSAIGGSNVGFVLDTWHWWTAGDTEADLLGLTNADVVSVDLNDAPRGIAKEQQQDTQRELPTATGVIDVATFVSALLRIGYDGPVRAEPFNRALNALDNEAACAAVSAALRRAIPMARAIPRT